MGLGRSPARSTASASRSRAPASTSRTGSSTPNPQLLGGWARAGVPITLASDAHVPQNVGRDLDRAIEQRAAAGYDHVTVFDRREAHQEPLG